VTLPRITRPRCWLLYALAPDGLPPAEVNRRFNDYIGRRSLPLVIYHDHFIGQPGGLAIFFAETEAERQALLDPAPLAGWRVEIHPLIYSHNPAAFDAQTAFTLSAYRGLDWEQLQRDNRPPWGDPGREADTASEDSDADND
jgi:hypothetical protein